MTKSLRIKFSLITALIGWFSIGFGYRTSMGHPTSAFLFLIGLGQFIGTDLYDSYCSSNKRFVPILAPAFAICYRLIN